MRTRSVSCGSEIQEKGEKRSTTGHAKRFAAALTSHLYRCIGDDRSNGTDGCQLV